MTKPLHWLPTPEGYLRPATYDEWNEAVMDGAMPQQVETWDEDGGCVVTNFTGRDRPNYHRGEPNALPQVWEVIYYPAGWTAPFAVQHAASEEKARQIHEMYVRLYLGEETT